MAGISEELRQAVLQAAIQGKLTQQLPEDGNAETLLSKIKEEKEKLIKEKKIKKEKAFAPINEAEIPFEIPDNWKWVRFGNLGNYKKGPFGSALTKSMFVPKGSNSIKVYEQKNAIQKDASLGSYYITREYFESKMMGFEVFPGDVIVSCAGTIGESYILPAKIEQGIINQALMRMRIFEPMYLPYFLMYFDFVLKKDARNSSKGSAIKNIPPFEILKNYLIPIPPLSEQHRIVARVEELMSKIDELEKIEKELTALRAAFPGDMKTALLQAAMQGKLTEQLDGENIDDILSSLVINAKLPRVEEYPFDIPETWKWIQIGNLGKSLGTESFSDGPFGSNLKREHQVLEPEVRIIQLSNIGEVGWRDENEKYTSFHHLDNVIPRCEVEPNDFVIAKMMPAGRTIIVPNLGTRITLGSDAMKFKPNPILDKKYLLYAMHSEAFLGQVYASAHGITRVRTTLNRIKSGDLLIPPLAEQHLIVEKLDKLLPLCESLETNL